MKVLRVITRMNVGGPARQVAFMHQALITSGHVSKVIYGQLEEGEADFSDLFESRENTFQLKSLRRAPHFWNDLKSTLVIFYELLRGDYHVIHTHTAKAFVVDWRLSFITQ